MRLQHIIFFYFQDLFKSNGCMGDEIFSKVERKVMTKQNQDLVRPFESFEIKVVVFSMRLDKSLDPDGLKPSFYQAFWDIIRYDVSTACLYYI